MDPTNPTPSRPAFEWQGNLDDDCLCYFGPLAAHAERMECKLILETPPTPGAAVIGALTPREPLESWWVQVLCNDEVLFDSGDAAGLITTGHMARAIAEALMIAANPFPTTIHEAIPHPRTPSDQ